MDSYTSIINELKNNNLKNSAFFKQDDNIDRYIDIDKFYKLLYHLFNSNSLLELNNNAPDAGKINKFVFTEEYPEDVMKDESTVTFEITRRQCASFSAKHEFMSESHVQYRPMFLYEKEDAENGGVKAYYMQPYDNEITLFCWAKEVKTARNIAGLIENIFTVSYHFIRQKVGALTYMGRYAPITKTHYGNKGMIAIPVKILVRTYEISCVKKQILDKLPQLVIEEIK